MTPEERKYIDDLIYRKQQEVIKVMKKIPRGQLYAWKEDDKR